ncbi:DMT family transporter [Roseovarius sp.]
MTSRLGLLAVLTVVGAGWGLTTPLSKIAVSEGYMPFGLIFWQLVIAGFLLSGFNALRGRGLPRAGGDLRFFLVIALTGTVIPNSASFAAAVHLPAGVIAILISTVPMFAFPIAIGLRIDRFGLMRLGGLMAGLAGVVLMVAPRASLPDPAMIAFVPLALVAPFFYAVEGNIVSKWGTRGMDAIQVLSGASLLGAMIALPLALVTGQWISPLPPWGAPDAALLASSIIHAVVYASYVWLVGQAGAVFAAQVAYLVTAFGVTWSMTLLGESYSGYVWAAFGVLMAGLFLVQPRPAMRLAPVRALREDGRDTGKGGGPV